MMNLAKNLEMNPKWTSTLLVASACSAGARLFGAKSLNGVNITNTRTDIKGAKKGHNRWNTHVRMACMGGMRALMAVLMGIG